MESIGTVDAQESLKPTESDEGGAVCQWDVTDAPLRMAQIVRFFDEEEEARGRGEKRISAATTEQHRAYEFIEARFDAAESQYTDVTRVRTQ